MASSSKDRLLADWHIIILRPKQQTEALSQFVTALGGTSILLPMLDIVPMVVTSIQLQEQIHKLQKADKVIISSPNAVACADPLLIQALVSTKIKIVTMGKATTALLLEKGVSVFFTATPGLGSEGLLMMPFMQQKAITGQKIVLLAGIGGREVIAQELKQRGAHVDWIRVYQQAPINLDIMPYLLAWQQKNKYAFVATSVNILENLLRLIPSTYHHWLQAKPVVVISDRIAQVAKKWGFQHIFVTPSLEPQTLVPVLQCMTQVCDTTKG